MTSTSDWKKLCSRLAAILREENAIPLLFGKAQSGVEEWQKNLNGLIWQWDTDPPLENSQNSNLSNLKELNLNHQKTPLIGVFTSGSTGTPKCILHKQDSLISSARISGELLDLKEGDQLITTLPFFHMGGLLTGLRSLIFKTDLILCPSFELEDRVREAFSTVEKKIFVVGVPAQLPSISPILKEEAPLAKNRFTFYAGGDSVRSHKWKSILETGANLIATYGQSESCGAILYQEEPDGETKTYSDCKVETTDGNTLSYQCDRLAHSILALKENSIHQTLLKESAFFETADLIKLHSLKDSKFRIEFIGRKDQLFQCGGEMISPQQVKKRILKLIENLAETDASFIKFRNMKITVIGVPHTKLGQVPVAFIEGLKRDQMKALARAISAKESGPQKLRYLSAYPSYKGIKPSLNEFLASYEEFSIEL